MGAQLRRHQPSEAARKLQSRRGLDVELVAEPARGRQHGEARTEALHAAPLLIHADEQRRGACRMDGCGECGELRGINIIAGKEDDAAHQGVAQQLAILGRQFAPRHIDHEGSEGHAAPPCAAGRSSSAIDSTCMVCGNMSTTPAACKLKPYSCTSVPTSRARLPGWQEIYSSRCAPRRATVGKIARAARAGRVQQHVRTRLAQAPGGPGLRLRQGRGGGSGHCPGHGARRCAAPVPPAAHPPRCRPRLRTPAPTPE